MVVRFEDFYDWRDAAEGLGTLRPNGIGLVYEAADGAVMAYWDLESASGAIVVEE